MRSVGKKMIVILVGIVLFIYPTSAYAAAPQIVAKSYMLEDYVSGEILTENLSDQPLPPASMTKMMVEFILLDRIQEDKLSWNDTVTVSKRAASIGEASIQLRAGDKISLHDLYVGMAVESANDATVAIAEYVGGSEENFVQLMNAKAQELGMKNTHFANATGLDTASYPIPPKTTGPHVMSAHDAAILASQLIHTHPELLEVTSLPKYTFYQGTSRQLTVYNWNHMLPGFSQYYAGVDGLKTGHINTAGYCFTGTVNRSGYRLISVVMGTASEFARFDETRKLFDYGYDQYTFQTLVDKEQAIPSHPFVHIPNADVQNVPVVAKQDIVLPIHVNEQNKYTIDVTYRAHLEAPITKGQVVGRAVVLYNGQEIPGLPPYDVVARDDVKEATWVQLASDRIKILIEEWFN